MSFHLAEVYYFIIAYWDHIAILLSYLHGTLDRYTGTDGLG
jgi:hypothetical protein